MAAASSPNNSSNSSMIHSFPNELQQETTFVLTDPDTFRAVVQRLTGPDAGDNGHRKPAFETRPTARKLKIKLHPDNGGAALHSPARNHGSSLRVVASPVSPLEYAAARGTPATASEEEEMAIAAKGFYFHPSPLSTPAGSDPPELLPLFPLHSPSQNYESSSF